MKLIALKPKPVEKGSIQNLTRQIKNLLPFGKSENHSEDAIIVRLARGLDNRFVMLQNLPLEGSKGIFPPILIGPTGLIVLNVSPSPGYFRVKEESWWEMNKTTHRFGPGRPNLIKQSQEYAQKLAELLDKHKKNHPEIVPVLIFADPGVNIEMTNPAIRIVRMDGVENLISDITRSEEVLGSNEVDFLADGLEIMGNPEKAIPIGEGEDFFGRDLLEPEKKTSFKLPKVKLPTHISMPPIEEKLKFSPRQWLIIEILMILTIVVLLGGIIYVLLTY